MSRCARRKFALECAFAGCRTSWSPAQPRSLCSSPSPPLSDPGGPSVSFFWPLLAHRQLNHLTLAHPFAHPALHRFHNFFSFAHGTKNAKAHPQLTKAKVARTLTNTLKNVTVLTAQPNPLALSSNRSAPKGQICGLTKGERRGRG